jgi:antitoxin component YwqK of YwqJK toxin-antitoxin module
VVSNPIDIEVLPNLKYYWYSEKSGEVNTVGGYSGRLLHGKRESFNLDGTLRAQDNFDRGLKNGVQKIWNDEVQLERVEHVNKGECYKAEYYTAQDANGNWVKSQTFAIWEYKPVEPSKIRTEKERAIVAGRTNLDESCLCVGVPGCSKRIMSYESNLPLSRIDWFVDQVMIETFYFPSTQKAKVTIEYHWMESDIGEYLEFYQNGKIRAKGKYKGDKPTGTMYFYDESGKEIGTNSY